MAKLYKLQFTGFFCLKLEFPLPCLKSYGSSSLYVF